MARDNLNHRNPNNTINLRVSFNQSFLENLEIIFVITNTHFLGCNSVFMKPVKIVRESKLSDLLAQFARYIFVESVSLFSRKGILVWPDINSNKRYSNNTYIQST